MVDLKRQNRLTLSWNRQA